MPLASLLPWINPTLCERSNVHVLLKEIVQQPQIAVFAGKSPTDGKMAFGTSSPPYPALHRHVPMSRTSEFTSSARWRDADERRAQIHVAAAHAALASTSSEHSHSRSAAGGALMKKEAQLAKTQGLAPLLLLHQQGRIFPKAEGNQQQDCTDWERETPWPLNLTHFQNAACWGGGKGPSRTCPSCF